MGRTVRTGRHDILRFIKSFHSSDDIDEIFSGKENSYWFAMILFRKYIRDGAEIVINRAGMFGTKIHGEIYSIRGEISDGSMWRSYKQ